MDFHHEFNGGIKYIHYFTRALADLGVDVEIVSALDKGKPRKTKKDGVHFTFLGPMVEWRRLHSPWKLLFSYNLSRYLGKNDFDIFHSHDMHAYFYLHRKKRKPTIMQPWGAEPFTGEESKGQRGLKGLYVEIFLKRPWRYCMDHADAIASEGDFQTPTLVKLGMPKKNIFNLPTGIDLPTIDKRLKSKRTTRKDIGVGKDDFVVITVNQITEDKGTADFVPFFLKLKQTIKNAKMLIVGAGAMEQYLLEEIGKHGLQKDMLRFKNIPEQLLYDLYAMSDVYLSATRQDDFIMSIQEAMACYKPIVSTGQRWIVQHGRNGFIVPKKDPTAMANAVVKLRDSRKAKRMGKESRKIVEQYDWHNIARTAIKKYEELME